MSATIMDRMVAHLKHKGIAKFPELPPEHSKTLQHAHYLFTHGQFAQASATILSIPSEYNHYPSYIILRVRNLLAQGYYHQAVRVLREGIESIDEKEAELRDAGRRGGNGSGLEAGDVMLRDTWRLWIKLLFWDEEGMSEEKRKEVSSTAFRAWKEWLEYSQIETYSEVHSLLFEIIHQLGVGTCSLPLNEWADNINSLLTRYLDSRDFTQVLAILRVRNKVIDPTDPSLANVMLEYYPHLGPNSELKLVDARTRLILYDMYILTGNTDAAHRKLVEIEDCLRIDAEEHENDDEDRGYDIRWLVRFYKIISVGNYTRTSDGNNLAKLSALAHEAVNRDIPEFQLKALNELSKIYLRNRDFANFTDPEKELIVKGQKYGQPAAFWRKHLHDIFENFPAPDHPNAEEFLVSFTEVMEGVEWTRDSEHEGLGVVGTGLGLVVWTGVAEMMVGIEEFWRAKARRMVEKVKAEEAVTGSRVDREGLSRGLRSLWEE